MQAARCASPAQERARALSSINQLGKLADRQFLFLPPRARACLTTQLNSQRDATTATATRLQCKLASSQSESIHCTLFGANVYMYRLRSAQCAAACPVCTPEVSLSHGIDSACCAARMGRLPRSIQKNDCCARAHPILRLRTHDV